MDYTRLFIGGLAGLVVGAVNFFLLRTFVKIALKYTKPVWGIVAVITSYLLRYIFIGWVIYYLMKRGEILITLTMIAILLILTIGLALWQQKRRRQVGG
jgi:hypothetical protein